MRLDRQALSLLIHTSRDLASAEIYCHQGGDPILPTGLALVASRLGLPIPTRPKSNGNTKKPDQHRIGDLARLLVEMLLIKRAGVEEPEEFNQSSQVGRILESQALHLDITKVSHTISTSEQITNFRIQ